MIRRLVLQRPLPHQRDVLLSPSRFKVPACGRRWGKTRLGLRCALVGHGPIDKNGIPLHRGAIFGANIWWVTKSYKVAEMIWTFVKAALARWKGLEKNEQLMRIRFPGGGELTIMSGHEPDALRGPGLHGLVFDECAFCPVESWEVLRPALSDFEGWAVFISSPNAHNWFYDIFQRGQNGNAFYEPGWESWRRPSSDNPTIRPSELEAMKREMGSFKYRRECECEFLAAEGGMIQPQWFRFYDALPQALTSFCTADLTLTAKEYSDFTVMGAWGRAPDNTLYLIDMVRLKLEGPRVVPLLTEFMNRHGLKRVVLEHAGTVARLNADAAAAGRLHGFEVYEMPTGNRPKDERAQPLGAAIEAGHLLFPRASPEKPWVQQAVDELCAFPDPTVHDDVVDMCALAVAVSPFKKADQPAAAVAVQGTPAGQQEPRGLPPERQQSGWWTGRRDSGGWWNGSRR